MTAGCFYLDESGDLGWTFDQPYRTGGSSRFLTIAALAVPSDKRHLPKRLIRDLYTHFRWNTKRETKWSLMNETERLTFAKKTAGLVDKDDDLSLFAIVVRKERVQPHIQADQNKLYNYMTRLLLSEEIAKYDQATLVPDARSIKVESGNSLHDYLQTHVWFEMGAKTVIQTTPSDSSKNLNLQFADMLAGVVGSHYEWGVTDCWNVLEPHLDLQELYFRRHCK